MLDAAVCGAVVTSPSLEPILEAIKAVKTDKGVLLVVKNYTGDVMNFEMASQLAEAEDIKVAKVIVNDDVAVMNSTWTVSRRGIAGTVFVHKICGAAAGAGLDFDAVQKTGERVIANVRSMGIALSPCTVPAAGKPGFDLGKMKSSLALAYTVNPES